jgi:hypothetical protein
VHPADGLRLEAITNAKSPDSKGVCQEFSMGSRNPMLHVSDGSTCLPNGVSLKRFQESPSGGDAGPLDAGGLEQFQITPPRSDVALLTATA